MLKTVALHSPNKAISTVAGVHAYGGRYSQRGPGGTIVVAIVVVLLSLLVGLVSVSASPILIGLTAAALVGPMLLSRPSWIIWMIFVLGILVAGLVPIWAEGLAGRAVWGISALGFLLMLSAIFRMVTAPDTVTNTPAFVWLALAFMVFALLASLMRWYSMYETVAGFKRYFQGFGLLFALAWLPVRSADVKRWLRFFIVAALLQLPFALYELVRLVPMREGFRYAYPGLVPIDVVAGTFGSYLYQGGANAEMATFQILVLIFLLSRFHQRQIGVGRLMALAPLVLAPLFLGETKVVVVLLPLAFIVLYRRQIIANPLYAFMGLLLGTILTTAALFTYVAVTKSKSLDALVRETLSYNVGNKGHGGAVLNRTTVIMFWAKQQSFADPVSAVVGNGIGSSHDATGGHVSLRYPGFGIGLTAASTLLWDLGLLGSMLFLSILVAAWHTASQLRRHCKDPAVQADARAIQAALALFGFYIIYRIALLELLSFQIIFAAVLGYLAWLKRNHLPMVTSVGR